MSETGQNHQATAVAVYILYIAALISVVPFFFGVILAYIFKARASPAARSHFDHHISLFWRFLIAGAVLGTLMAIGAMLSIILIGIPIFILAGLCAVYLWFWMLFRCLKGIGAVTNDQPYDGPWGWGI